jgi:hypothetical protein
VIVGDFDIWTWAAVEIRRLNDPEDTWEVYDRQGPINRVLIYTEQEIEHVTCTGNAIRIASHGSLPG